MHLLIVLLQQLLGMLSGAKKVVQPEAVRKGTPTPNGSEPDACSRIAPSQEGWMTMISRAVSFLWGHAAGLHSQRSGATARLRSGSAAARRSLRERTHTRGTRGD